MKRSTSSAPTAAAAASTEDILALDERTVSLLERLSVRGDGREAQTVGHQSLLLALRDP